MIKTELAPQVTISPKTLLPRWKEFIDFDPNLDALTPKEEEVIALIAQGLSNPRIGTALSISTVTVEHHLVTIFDKLHIDHDPNKKTRVEAATRHISQNPDFKNPFDGHELTSPFTPREKEILSLIGEGLLNDVIGEKILIGERTVEDHIDHILSKIGFDKEKQNGRVVMMLVSRAKLKIPTK